MLTAGQLNWKPNAQTWSIGQNIHHLIVINETYFPVIQSIRNGTFTLPFTARINFIVSFLGKTILSSVNPDRKKRMKTFPIWEPSKSNIDSDILNKFENHQSKLKDFIASSSDLLQKGQIISSPANKHIIYKLEAAFDIIVTHERRHYAQALEIKGQLSK